MQEVSAPTGLVFEPDRLASRFDLQLRKLRHRLWLHPEVSDRLRDWTHLYRRLGLVLQHLAAHGRTTIVKGCRDANRGWRRSPLGGGQGMQFYLWWTPEGSPVAKHLALHKGAILVRAVRTHGNHAPLAAGDIDDYLPLDTAEDLGDGDGIAGQPWTEAQIDFVTSDQQIRLLHGRPGSGKTTALWKAVEARSAQRVLYLTWSRALTRNAQERFASFAPANVKVTTLDFASFVGEMCGSDVVRQPLRASRDRFIAAMAELSRGAKSPWTKRHSALHAELRAVLFGRAIPGEPDCIVDRGIARLTDDAYYASRGTQLGVGPKAATALLKVARALPSNLVNAVFPELVSATRAIQRLRGARPPEGFEDFDRIVVDEVQDLTLLESALVVELCHAIARDGRGRAPWLLMAGDAGQTVRPTGFEWGPLSDLLANRVGPPAKFHLEHHLRCPSRIAATVDRASIWYAEISKHVRPTRQRRQHGGEHVDAHLLYVQVSDRAEAVRLLEELADADEVVVLSPHNDRPAWIPEELRNSVLVPEEVKGLEYQSVCVLDPGHLLRGLDLFEPGWDETELDQMEHRTNIDHLRVTLSRATETLAFIDCEPTDTERDLSMEILDEAVPYSAEDLLDHFTHADASPEERVLVRISDAKLLIDTAPGRAWQRACQAFGLLGDAELPNGVSDPTLREEARLTLLSTAARLLVDGAPEGVIRASLFHMADHAAGQAPDSSTTEVQAVAELDRWTFSELALTSTVELLDVALELGERREPGSNWLRPALAPVAQKLRVGLSACAAEPRLAERFNTGSVEGWLRLTGYEGDVSARAELLRIKAFDSLLKAVDSTDKVGGSNAQLKLAADLLEKIPPDMLRLGRLREAQRRPEEAADLYARANAPKEALRVWRTLGRWERATEFDEGDARADLEWLIELERLIESRPPQQNKRLYDGERERLKRLLGTIEVDHDSRRPARK